MCGHSGWARKVTLGQKKEVPTHFPLLTRNTAGYNTHKGTRQPKRTSHQVRSGLYIANTRFTHRDTLLSIRSDSVDQTTLIQRSAAVMCAFLLRFRSLSHEGDKNKAAWRDAPFPWRGAAQTKKSHVNEGLTSATYNIPSTPPLAIVQSRHQSTARHLSL